MSAQEQGRKPLEWLPERRFDADFPLAFWFAGLWMYLKSFLYLCNVYSMGLEPPPYSTFVIAEAIYFGVMIVPAFLLGFALWNERKWVVPWAIFFLLVDTPVLLFHVMRLSESGFMDSDLTRVLEFGALGLNVVSLGWLLGYRTMSKTNPPKERAGSSPKR
jgi:hypothetical protein